MRASVIFHSVCGNTSVMANRFMKALKRSGGEVALYRVEDEDIERWRGIFPVAREHMEEILSLPVATPKSMLESDLVVLGCPTYFGNVSAEMKAFLDSTAEYWVMASLAGRRLAVFTSASTIAGGGDVCLKALITYGQHMGMVHVPLPANLCPGIAIPAYGPIHYSGETGDIRPGGDLVRIIDAYSNLLMSSGDLTGYGFYRGTGR